jgi:hypothetical protein
MIGMPYIVVAVLLAKFAITPTNRYPAAKINHYAFVCYRG